MKSFDKEFLGRLKVQDHNAFDEFYLKSVDMFFRYVKSNYFLPDEEIEDVLSRYFIKQRDAFPKLDLDKSFSAYVWTIFKNTLKDHFKKMKDISFSVIDAAGGDSTSDEYSASFEDQLEDDLDLGAVLNLNFQIEQIELAMQELDDLNKDIIYLKYIEEKSNQEIAEYLQISNDSVRQRCSRAIKQLKILLVD